MATIAQLKVALSATTSGLTSGFKSAAAIVANFASSVKGLATAGIGMLLGGIQSLIGGFIELGKAVLDVVVTLGKWALITAGAAAAGATALFIKMANIIDGFAELNDRTGVSVKAITELSFAFEQANIETETGAKNLVKMQNNISDAARGAGTAKKAFKELGINASSLNNLPITEQFARISKAFQDVENAGDRTRLAIDIFGKSGVEMLAIIKEGPAALSKYAQQARQTGIVLSTAEAQGVAKMLDSMNLFGKQAQGLGMQITAKLAPTVDKLIQQAFRFTQAWFAARGGIKGVAGDIANKLIVKGKELLDFFAQFKQPALEAWDALKTGVQGLVTVLMPSSDQVKGFASQVVGLFLWMAKEIGLALPLIGAFVKVGISILGRWIKFFVDVFGPALQGNFEPLKQALAGFWEFLSAKFDEAKIKIQGLIKEFTTANPQFLGFFENMSKTLQLIADLAPVIKDLMSPRETLTNMLMDADPMEIMGKRGGGRTMADMLVQAPLPTDRPGVARVEDSNWEAALNFLKQVVINTSPGTGIRAIAG